MKSATTFSFSMLRPAIARQPASLQAHLAQAFDTLVRRGYEVQHQGIHGPLTPSSKACPSTARYKRTHSAVMLRDAITSHVVPDCRTADYRTW
jgi:hypothetical protein